MTKTIYTTGYPRSGTWWLTRLLSDLLDSDIKTLPPDNVTVADFRQTGQGGYTIYKTHWRAHEWNGQGKVVFIQRDPRDVAVSAMYYRNLAPTDENLMGVIKTMAVPNAKPPFKIYHETGVYERWVRGWIDIAWPNQDNIFVVGYETLHSSPVLVLLELKLLLTGQTILSNEIKEIVERQSFSNWSAKYPHSMRKGIAGDWRNHFKRQHGEYITAHLGELMLEQGYIEDLEWWREL